MSNSSTARPLSEIEIDHTFTQSVFSNSAYADSLSSMGIYKDSSANLKPLFSSSARSEMAKLDPIYKDIGVGGSPHRLDGGNIYNAHPGKNAFLEEQLRDIGLDGSPLTPAQQKQVMEVHRFLNELGEGNIDGIGVPSTQAEITAAFESDYKGKMTPDEYESYKQNFPDTPDIVSTQQVRDQVFNDFVDASQSEGRITSAQAEQIKAEYELGGGSRESAWQMATSSNFEGWRAQGFTDSQTGAVSENFVRLQSIAVGMEVLKQAGVAGDLLSLAMVNAEANALYEAGDTQGGNRLWTEYAFETGFGMAGGLAIGAFAAAAGAPLLLGIAAGVGVGLAASYVGKEVGGYLYDQFPEAFDAFFAGLEPIGDLPENLGIIANYVIGGATDAFFSEGKLFAEDGPIFGEGGLLDEGNPFAEDFDMEAFKQAILRAKESLDDGIKDFVEHILELFDDPRPSPLVLDLDGDGIELTALDGSSAHFDLNINGFAELTGWVSPDDALLALDVNGDGIINDGSELFGDQTGHDHGFLALDVNGINVNRMSARAINLNAVNDNHSPSIKPAA